MKLITSSLLSIFIVIFFLTQSVCASTNDVYENSVGDVNEVYIGYYPTYDLQQVQSMIKQYRNGTFEYQKGDSDTREEYIIYKLDELSKRNCLLLPSFVDTANLKNGDVNVLFDEMEGEIRAGGSYGNYEFTISLYYGENNIAAEKDSLNRMYKRNNIREEQRQINGVKVIGIQDKSYRYIFLADGFRIDTQKPDLSGTPFEDSEYKLIETTQADDCYFYFETPDGFYRLYVSGAENFDTVFENFEMTIYPLTNGFVHSNGKTLYSYNGEFLRGWYKIGGKRYYFDSDGIMATGTVSINGRKYSFGDDGVYIE
jgi:hypothetical protein